MIDTSSNINPLGKVEDLWMNLTTLDMLLRDARKDSDTVNSIKQPSLPMNAMRSRQTCIQFQRLLTFCATKHQNPGDTIETLANIKVSQTPYIIWQRETQTRTFGNAMFKVFLRSQALPTQMPYQGTHQSWAQKGED
ncbi:hypothetical protein Pelo_3029 [Pelomyxa schiedti]|nr:hypothetical protein Pelo_3029 [Pelomyxa schiedti]